MAKWKLHYRHYGLNAEFLVSPKDWLYIEFHKVLLFIKRQWRRVCGVCSASDIILYAVITFFWLLFALASYWAGRALFEGYSFLKALWEIRTSYFTSVILAFTISFCNQAFAYKRKIREQYILYIDTMSDFELLFVPYIAEYRYQYIPFYCQKTLRATLKYINSKFCDYIPFDARECKLSLISDRLNKINNQLQRGNILYLKNADIFEVTQDIEYAQRIISNITENDFLSGVELSQLSSTLLYILNHLRVPWRCDITTKLNILSKLDSDEIRSDYYYNMLFNGYDFPPREVE